MIKSAEHNSAPRTPTSEQLARTTLPAPRQNHHANPSHQATDNRHLILSYYGPLHKHMTNAKSCGMAPPSAQHLWTFVAPRMRCTLAPLTRIICKQQLELEPVKLLLIADSFLCAQAPTYAGACPNFTPMAPIMQIYHHTAPRYTLMERYRTICGLHRIGLQYFHSPCAFQLSRHVKANHPTARKDCTYKVIHSHE